MSRRFLVLRGRRATVLMEDRQLIARLKAQEAEWRDNSAILILNAPIGV
jgi:hypothetical protein